jgi:iron-sulfur cluster repair protein YtfE (RIC family)
VKVTDAFLGEHAVFYAQFAACERTLAGADLVGIRREAALIASALQTHAELENTLLFDDLQMRPGAPMFHVMEQEHGAIENMLAQIQDTLDAERARILLLDVIEAARLHFMKEERMAFPAAEQMLGTAQLLRLGERWAEARGVFVAESLPAEN